MHQAEAYAILQWYFENGVDEALAESPVNRLAPKLALAAVDASQGEISDVSQQVASGAPAVTLAANSELRAEAERLAAAANSLDDLRAALQSFDGLDIKKTAMNMVFASGNPQAKLMVIGEVPDADEDRSGQAFAGLVGQLADKMFAAIGLDRSSLYITNVLPWRPPGNRSALPNEVDMLLPFLRRHIELVSPTHIFLMGALGARALLGADDVIGKLRGKVHTYNMGDKEVPVMVTYHPSFLLKTPSRKREAWDDLLQLKSALLQ